SRSWRTRSACRLRRLPTTRTETRLGGSMRRNCRRSLGCAASALPIGAPASGLGSTQPGRPIVASPACARCSNGCAPRALIPTAPVLERIGLIARVRARRRAFETLVAGLTGADRERLYTLLVNDPDVRRSRFAWLRDYLESPAPSNMIELLDRLEYVRARTSGHRAGVHRPRRRDGGAISGCRRGRSQGRRETGQDASVPCALAGWLKRARSCRRSTSPTSNSARRTAILVAQVAELETKLADTTLAMFEKYVGSLFTKARSKDERALRDQARCRESAAAVPADHLRAQAGQGDWRGGRERHRARDQHGPAGARAAG